MYKIIACDLDDTLLNNEKHVSNKDIDTIRNLKDCKFVVTTGRSYNAAKPVLEELGFLDRDNEYLISFNGGFISECKTDKVLYSTYLDFNRIKYLFDLGLNYDISIEVCTESEYYGYNLSEYEIEGLNKAKYKYKTFTNFEDTFSKNQKFAKIMYISNNVNYLDSIRKQIDLKDIFDVTISSNMYMEFIPKGINKGFGLQNLCNILNIDIKNTIGVGDSLNDIELIKKSGLGIGVNNVIESVKPYCDVILDSDNNNSPITEIVDKFINKS